MTDLRPDLLVRDSVPGDLERVAAIYAHHVLHGFGSFEEEPPSLAEIGQRRDSSLARSLPHLVGVIGGEVVGFAYAAPWRTRTAYRYTVETSVYVAPDGARRGIGRALLASLLDRCIAVGLREAVAVIGDSGNAGSIGLHAALGFRHVGTLTDVGWKRGRSLDTVLMQRRLAPPP